MTSAGCGAPGGKRACRRSASGSTSREARSWRRASPDLSGRMTPGTKSSDLPVAILAGGLATRLRPATEKVPKLLVEVAGEPFLTHQIRLLRRAGLTRLVLCVGHLGEPV